MISNRRNPGEIICIVSDPEWILSVDRRAAFAADSASYLERYQLTPATFEAALRQVTTSHLMHECEDTLDSLADTPVSEELPASKTYQTPSILSARIGKAVLAQIADI